MTRRTWVTKSVKLPDGSRMTTRMSAGDYYFTGCLGAIFSGMWWLTKKFFWLFYFCSIGWIVWIVKRLIASRQR